LSVATAKDLQEDFLIHFPNFFDNFVEILHSKDADKTEYVLISLASFLKILKPYLCKNIDQIIHLMLPLLDETKQSDSIINFAVECFAFLIRSLNNKEYFLVLFLKNIQNREEFFLGAGKLFFEILRGTKSNFHSKGQDFLFLLFNFFENNDNEKLFITLREVSSNSFVIWSCLM
jgi:U3 small nucleolar RNA-associated protein 20